jgi:hypothetical protein
MHHESFDPHPDTDISQMSWDVDTSGPDAQHGAVSRWRMHGALALLTALLVVVALAVLGGVRWPS